LEKARENFKKFESEYNIKPISALKEIGIEELKKEIFDLLEIVRIYSKKPGQAPDFNQPFIVKRKTKLIALAKQISEDFAFSFKYARVFRKNSKKFRIVGKDYLLKDGDIIEIHT